MVRVGHASHPRERPKWVFFRNDVGMELCNQFKSKIMSERKTWTPEEDRILSEIVKAESSRRWSTIAQIMEERFGITDRTGKQCRQRWHNQLDPSIKNEGWTPEQEHHLFQLHSEFGNKWAKIAQSLPGRTDNSIKNHFYCTLRKAIRRVNRFLSEAPERWKVREFTSSLLSKIIAVAEDRFDHKLSVSEETTEKCIEIKNRLLAFSMMEEFTPENHHQLRLLMEDVEDFNKSYKRKRGRKKRKEKLPVEEQSDQEHLPKYVPRKSRQRADFVPRELAIKPKRRRSNKNAMAQEVKIEDKVNLGASCNTLKLELQRLDGAGLQCTGDLSPPHFPSAFTDEPLSTNLSGGRLSLEDQYRNFNSNDDFNIDSIFDVLRRNQDESHYSFWG